jgi:hypothetical protein
VSCIEPEEIAQITAAVFGVTLEEMGEPAPSDRRKSAFTRPGYAARACAVTLIQRHTNATCRASFMAVGLSGHHHIERMYTLIEVFRRYAARHPEIERRVEAIERQIDDIHEQRIEALNAPVVVTPGFAQLVKQLAFQ